MYFLPLSILKWLRKNSPILITFFKCALMWQLSQYNLTKWLRMELKTTKCYWSHVGKNHNGFFGQPNRFTHSLTCQIILYIYHISPIVFRTQEATMNKVWCLTPQNLELWERQVNTKNYSADLSIYRIWRSDFILKALGKSLKGKLEKRLPQICISMYHHCFGVAQVRKVSGYRKRDQLADCCYDLHQVMLVARA